MRFPFSGLNCASFLGVVEVVAALIETRSDDPTEGIWGGIHGSHGLRKMAMRKW